MRPSLQSRRRRSPWWIALVLAASGLSWAVAQSFARQDDPPEPLTPVVVEIPDAPVVIEAAVEAAEPEETEPAPGTVPAGDQAAAAALIAGSTNLVPSVPGDPGAPRSSRRTRERAPARDWRTSFGSTGTRNKDGSTNAPGPAKTDYAYFKAVNDRNIFNPSRQPNRPDRSGPLEARKVTKVEAFSLVGTLRYEKGDLAFFDGSSSEYRKGFKAGESLAGYKVVSVSDAAVRIEAKGTITELKIGSQMRREDEGEWKLTGSPYTGGSSGSSSSGETTAVSEGSGSATPASAGAGGGTADEILKRLLQKREQEMKNEK